MRSLSHELSTALFHLEQQKVNLEAFVLHNKDELEKREILNTLEQALAELESSINTLNTLF